MSAYTESKERSAVQVGGRTLDVTNLEKPLWPDAGITKADYIQYVLAVAPVLLPHLKGRPLTVTRYPNGIDETFFYQKNTPETAPPWIPRHRVRSKEGDKEIDYALAEEPATLVWLANQAAIEFHPWHAPVQHPDRPDRLVIDLDPAEGVHFERVVQVALWTKAVLDELGLQGYPKLSGATGLHIYVPIAPRYSYETTSGFVGMIGGLLERSAPDTVTTERLVKNRTGRVYVDHLQNLPTKTIVAPYSPRPLPGAPVSTPVAWEELTDLTPDAFTVRDVPQRIQDVGDLFEPLCRPAHTGSGQSLDPYLEAIEAWRREQS